MTNTFRSHHCHPIVADNAIILLSISLRSLFRRFFMMLVVVVVYCCELRRHFTSLTSRRSLSALSNSKWSLGMFCAHTLNGEMWDEREPTKPEWKSDCRNTNIMSSCAHRKRLKIIVKEMCGFEWHKITNLKKKVGNDNPLLECITFISFYVFHFLFLPQADKENYCELLTTVKWVARKRREINWLTFIRKSLAFSRDFHQQKSIILKITHSMMRQGVKGS